MGVKKLTLTEQHFKLLKHLNWSFNDKNLLISVEDAENVSVPFGENTIHEAIDLILNGVNENNLDPMNEEFLEYTDEEKAFFDKIYSELPDALDIVLFTGKFEVGTYKTKSHIKDWKKID